MAKTNGNIKELVEQMDRAETASDIQELLNQAGTLDEVTKAIHAFQDSQSDPMIERMASLMEPLGALANEVAKPEVYEALKGSLETLTELHRNGSMDSLKEMATVASAARASMTDSLLERSAETLGKLIELGDEVTKADLVRAMPALQELVNSGSLEVLTQMATFLGSATHAFTDSIVERMLTLLENLASRLVNPQIQDLLGAMVEGAQETMADMKQDPYQIGLRKVFKSLRDPEVQKGLLFLMNFAKNFHRSLASESGPKL